MLRGAPPFSAPDTRRLERAIVARRPVPLPAGLCPVGLHAIAAKLLGPTPADRYPSPEAIRQDLERFQSGSDTEAQKDGWPGRAADEPATRRTERGPDRLEEATRRTVPPPLPVLPAPLSTSTTTAPFPPRSAPSVPPLPPLPPRAPGRAPQATVPAGPLSIAIDHLLRVSQPARVVLAVLLVLFVGNEIMVGRAAGRIANTVPAQDLAALDDRWADYQRLSARSLGPATWRLESMLKRRTTALTDRLIASYREGLSVVWSAQWTEAREALVRAVAADPGSSTLNAALRYCDGHLHRINGDELKRSKKPDAARREFAAAITAFREAAQLRSNWPDPFIGLARTFVTGLGDVDRGADALEQARRLGYAAGERDMAQLADSYADRGDTLWRTARDLRSVPQERDYLNRAQAAYQRALELYAGVATFSGVPASVRHTQAGFERVQMRLVELDFATLTHDPGPLELVPGGANSDSNSGAAPQ
jgi:tetratricopeptide (TPR) repeat protein